MRVEPLFGSDRESVPLLSFQALFGSAEAARTEMPRLAFSTFRLRGSLIETLWSAVPRGPSSRSR